MESRLNGKEAADGDDLSPLDYLLSVMNDADAKPKLRIKAARIVAPYLHSHAQPKLGEMRIVISDSFGFEFDPAVVKANSERTQRFYQGDKTDPSPEQLELLEGARTPQWPAGSSYGEKEAQADWERITHLTVRRMAPEGLSEAEEIEDAHLHMRRGVYYAHKGRLDRSRIDELNARRTATNQLSAAEESELAELLKEYPDSPHLADDARAVLRELEK
jgi:hypothetical protein